MEHLYEHPSGVFIHADYLPATLARKLQIRSLHIADGSYKPVGPDLKHFLHGVYGLDTTGPVIVATPMLELIAEGINNGS